MVTRFPESLEPADFQIWFYLHHLLRGDVLDAVMPYLRNQYFWAPLYLFLLAFMAVNFGRRGLIWCAGFILCFALGDFISASVIKPLVQRTRPCNDLRLSAYLHLIVPRSTGYSFPSSHATNHFAMGTFSAITLNKAVRNIWSVPLLWGLLVSYAQVYVGVHFPFDVLAGALLGIIIGSLVARLYHYRFTLARAIGD
jgi:undecaprenyl-diphosphatase